MADYPVPALAGLTSVEPLTNPVVIGDVHLAATKPKTITAFLRFLKDVAPRYAELVILGDLFDYWLGDDAMPDADPIVAHLKFYASNGRRVLIMPGEKDFLMGQLFADACGAELLASPVAISVRGTRMLFAHGDEWCVRNRPYQAYRAVTRSPDWQADLLSRPVAERIALLREAEERARTENEAPRTPMEYGVIESTVAEAAREAGVELVMHGHTHHPGAHVNAVIERWCIPYWEFDQAGSGTRSGYVNFNAIGRPQIQLM